MCIPVDHSQRALHVQCDHWSQTHLVKCVDKLILAIAVPSMINLAVVPLVSAVDTFCVGHLGKALALAGQTAANQAVFTVYYLVAFLSMLTSSLVAAVAGLWNTEEAQ